jgi:hypothetical protein
MWKSSNPKRNIALDLLSRQAGELENDAVWLTVLITIKKNGIVSDGMEIARLGDLIKSDGMVPLRPDLVNKNRKKEP